MCITPHGPKRLAVRQACWLSLCIAIVSSCCSCQQDGPALGQVEGTVTLDGQPFPDAIVTFISTAENGTTSTGMTDENGRYRLQFTFKKRGAMVGRNDVKIEYAPASGAASDTSFQLPERYQSPGVLSFDVTRGHQVIDLALTSNPTANE